LEEICNFLWKQNEDQLAIEVKRKKMRKERPGEGVMWPFQK
jgi:hypothetical protein